MKEFLCCDYQRYVNFTFPIYLWPTVVFFRSRWIFFHSNVLLSPQSTFSFLPRFLRPLVSFSSSSYLLTVTHRKKVRLRGRKYDWGEQSTTEGRKVRLKGEKYDWEEKRKIERKTQQYNTDLVSPATAYFRVYLDVRTWRDFLCFAVRFCLKFFCLLWFRSSASFTGSHTEVKPCLPFTAVKR